MQKISDYILSLFIVSAAVGIVSMLAPEGENGGIKKFIKYIVSLAVTLTLLAPLGDIIYALPGIIGDMAAEMPSQDAVTLSPELYAEMTESSAGAIEAALESEISARYGVHCRVKLILDTSDYMSINITGVKYKISRADSLYIDLIEKLLKNTLCCEVEREIIE
jgi:hypothetical protein